MDDKSLFETHKVPGEAPKFQYTSPCSKCGSREHASGSCSTAALHLKRVNDGKEMQNKMAARRGKK